MEENTGTRDDIPCKLTGKSVEGATLIRDELPGGAGLRNWGKEQYMPKSPISFGSNESRWGKRRGHA